MTWEYVTYCEKQKSQTFNWNKSLYTGDKHHPLYVMLFNTKMSMQQHQATIPHNSLPTSNRKETLARVLYSPPIPAYIPIQS